MKRLLGDSAIYTFNAIISRGLAFFMVPLYARFLTLQHFGAFDILVSASALLNYIITLEVSQALAYYVATSKDPQTRTRFASTALWFTIFAYAGFVLIASLFCRHVSFWLVGNDSLTFTLRLYLISMVLKAIYFTSSDLLRWMLRPKQAAIASMGFAGVAFALSCIFLAYFNWGLEGVILAEIFAYSLAGLLALHSAGKIFTFQFKVSALKELLSFSLPLVPSSTGIFVALYADRLLIKEILNIEQVGCYGIAVKVAAIIGLLISGFQGALTPLIYQNHEKAETPIALARIFRYFVLAALCGLIGLGFFSHELVYILTAPKFYSAAAIIPALAMAVLFSRMYIFAPGLALKKKQRQSRQSIFAQHV